MSVPARGEIKALTSLRGAAALLVFLFHFAGDAPGLLGVAAHEGHVGVTIFFVLSGFLITGRYFDDFASGRASWRDYLWRRVARILPLYLAVLVLAGLAGGFDLTTARRIPEWTLTQAFFSTSLHDLVIPTSWSLTLEECFYLTAPVVFLAIARLRARVGLAVAATLVLGLVTVALWLAGEALVGTLPFLANEREMATHTFFGRFVEFAFGAAAGLAWRTGRLEGHGVTSTVVALAAAAAIVACEAAMAQAGDVAGPDWQAAWTWNVPIAAASAVLILALADRSSPLGRALGLAPLPYLGRISYALYLVQLTPLGKDLFYSLLPHETPLYVLALYLGMSLVSAILFESVEEPARRLVLRWTLGAVTEAPPVTASRARLLAGAIAGLVLLHGGAVLAGRQDAPVALAELPPDARRLAWPAAETVEADGAGHRVVLPRRWMEGPSVERRSPTWLLVWSDERPVPFVGIAEAPVRAAAGEHVAAYKRPRVHVVAVHAPVTREVQVAPLDSALWLRLQARRAGGMAVLASGVLAVATAVALARIRSRGLVYAARLGALFTLTDLALDLALVGYDRPAAAIAAALAITAVSAASARTRSPAAAPHP